MWPRYPFLGSISLLAGDNDKDGIIDVIDLDDDNDGILDSIEEEEILTVTVFQTGSILDSDGDGCDDVVEAGFEDPDNDGVLCSSPVEVDAFGRVMCFDDGVCEDDPNNNMEWRMVNVTQINDDVIRFRTID